MLWRQNDCMHLYVRVREKQGGEELVGAKQALAQMPCLPQPEQRAPLLTLPRAAVASNESVTFKTERGEHSPRSAAD